MKKSVLIGGAAALALIAVGVTALLLRSDARVDDPNLRRGKELLSIDEPDAAVREFRLALKADPKNQEAKALLLVALLRTDGALAGWFEAQIMFDRLLFLKESNLESLDGVEELSRRATQFRQELYDKGLDTRDTEEIWAITHSAAGYSFSTAEEEEQDHAAFVLGLHGDQRGVLHLVERLKSERAAYVPDLLARLGAAGEGPLLAVAGEHENLGRRRALDTLARLRERQASEELFKSATSIRGFTSGDLPAEYRDGANRSSPFGLTRDQALYGMNLRSGDRNLPLWVHWVELGPDGANRLLIVQALDQTKAEFVTRFYGFTVGVLTPLQLVAPPDLPTQLAKDGPIVAAELTGTSIELRQLGKGAVPTVQETKRSGYKTGDRVRVRGNAKDGTVTGVDEFGLLIIELDEPHKGVRKMSLTPGNVRGLETVLKQLIGLRRHEAFVVGSQLELRPASVELLPLTP